MIINIYSLINTIDKLSVMWFKREFEVTVNIMFDIDSGFELTVNLNSNKLSVNMTVNL